MRKIVFSIALFTLLLFQSSCVRHSKCDCVDKAINLSGVFIVYEEPFSLGVNGQYKVSALILPGNPSQEEINKAIEKDMNPYNGNQCYLIAGNRTMYKKYNLQNVNVALSGNYHNCFDEPQTFNILCIEKK